jgi:hypothetical protein
MRTVLPLIAGVVWRDPCDVVQAENQWTVRLPPSRSKLGPRAAAGPGTVFSPHAPSTEAAASHGKYLFHPITHLHRKPPLCCVAVHARTW